MSAEAHLREAERYGFERMRARRAGFFGLVLATTVAGAWMMLGIVGAQGFTPLEAAIVALFIPTFAWISLAFWTAGVGFVLLLARRHPITLARLDETLTTTGLAGAARGPVHAAADERTADAGRATGARPTTGAGRTTDHERTALLVPIYREDPGAVAARVSAMIRSLVEVGAAHRFDVHLLSDSPAGDIARREEIAWLRLQSEHPEVAVHYRRRERNTGRKAGNIGEFCRRCVDDYAYVVVLDADSLMTGDTLDGLTRRMAANPDVGLIQTLPLPIRQRTLFGRMVQFAGNVYAPLLAAGQSFWQGDAANYWGHNAIIRLRAFHDHARLPVLSGRPPLGGEVLSHDFVEAALLRRAGWKIVFDPTLGGSWEEVPGTVVDFARRDRRWAQGSLQHLRLLFEPGFHPASRLHFALGAMGYVSSLLWLLILVAGTTYVALPEVGDARSFGAGWSVGVPVSLLAVTGAILFVPKLLGATLVLVRARAEYGGAARFAIGVVGETLFSVLLAPVMMLYHTRAVLAILAGRSVDWTAHPRDGASLGWRESLVGASLPTAVGVLWGGATLVVSPLFFLWMSPIFVGLLVSVPLLRVSSSPRAGWIARRWGLLVVPSEVVPPATVSAVREAGTRTSRKDLDAAIGVDVDPQERVARYSPTVGRSMHNAERGLFDLRQGRPFLIGYTRASTAEPGALVATVEGLDPGGLARLRELAGGSLRLVLTRHRVAAMGLGHEEDHGTRPMHAALPLGDDVSLERIVELSCAPSPALGAAPEGLVSTTAGLVPATPAEAAGLSLVRLGRLLPALVVAPVGRDRSPSVDAALESGELLEADVDEVFDFVARAGAEVVRLGEAPVPLPEAEDSRFVLFREGHGLQEHVAILVGAEEGWPDPVPVRLHSACLTGDLFGSLRCDCGDQLRASLAHFVARGGGVLLYLAQEGRGIGLRNKFRAYTLQETGLDTIEADGALGFGPDERSYDVAVRILEDLGVRRVELLTNNPEKVRAMSEAGINVVRRCALHGTLNRHNLPYVRAKVQRAGHWLGDMLSQPLPGD